VTLAAVTSLSRRLGEWAARPANEQFLRADQQSRLARSLDDPRRRPQVHVAAWLLGTWHLGHGFVEVLGGNGRGFDEARTGQALRRCSLLLRARHGQPARRAGPARLSFSQQQGTLTALFGLALHDPGAEPLYELLRRQPDAAFAADDHLPLFVRALLALHAGERPAVTPRLGPYREVLLHWHGDPRTFALRLADVLELHLQQALGAGSTSGDPPGLLYPLEVLAVRAVRDGLGLPTPKVEHPLMYTNLAQMAPDPRWPAHDLAARLERLAGPR